MLNYMLRKDSLLTQLLPAMLVIIHCRCRRLP